MVKMTSEGKTSNDPQSLEVFWQQLIEFSINKYLRYYHALEEQKSKRHPVTSSSRTRRYLQRQVEKYTAPIIGSGSSQHDLRGIIISLLSQASRGHDFTLFLSHPPVDIIVGEDEYLSSHTTIVHWEEGSYIIEREYSLRDIEYADSAFSNLDKVTSCLQKLTITRIYLQLDGGILLYDQSYDSKRNLLKRDKEGIYQVHSRGTGLQISRVPRTHSGLRDGIAHFYFFSPRGPLLRNYYCNDQNVTKEEYLIILMQHLHNRTGIIEDLCRLIGEYVF